MQISYKVSRIVAEAVPDLQNHIKLFFINLFQFSAEYVTSFLKVQSMLLYLCIFGRLHPKMCSCEFHIKVPRGGEYLGPGGGGSS